MIILDISVGLVQSTLFISRLIACVGTYIVYILLRKFSCGVDDLVPEDHIQTFLTRTIVLDELQRVFEDDKFRLVNSHVHIVSADIACIVLF